MSVRKIRRSHIIGPYGPGAIVDLVGESFVAEDAGQWRGFLPTVEFPRLARYLDVRHLKSPPAGGAVPYFRFPQWLFCFSCRTMVRWSYKREKPGQAPKCETCPGRRNLLPMRFVAACADGHLTDIDWRHWAHTQLRRDRDQTQCARDNLAFENRSDAGGGLNSLVVRCRTCGSFRSLDRITKVGTLPQKCYGTQPWQNQTDRQPCDKKLVALQRGASNVYFPTIHSAIDIPPDSDWHEVTPTVAALKEYLEFGYLINDWDDLLPLVRETILKALVDKSGVSAAEIQVEVRRQRSVPGDGTVADIRPDEWGALCNPRGDHDPRDSFITRRADRPYVVAPADGVESEMARLLDAVVLVEKLREVRVLTEFKRYKMESAVRANISNNREFLPAVEVFGEGFFLRFNEDAVTKWESDPPVRARATLIANRLDPVTSERFPKPSPRYLLLHTFAHLLLRHTAFEAGYSTSSLRERLYVTPESGAPAMSGILIYTAAGDSEGTLGGLVRMGEHTRLSRLLTSAVAAAQWCSFDPVCSESKGQGPGGLSLAACHACALVPETSCDEAANRLLDRALLIHDDYGFFTPLAKALDQVPGGGTW